MAEEKKDGDLINIVRADEEPFTVYVSGAAFRCASIQKAEVLDSNEGGLYTLQWRCLPPQEGLAIEYKAEGAKTYIPVVYVYWDEDNNTPYLDDVGLRSVACVYGLDPVLVTEYVHTVFFAAAMLKDIYTQVDIDNLNIDDIDFDEEDDPTDLLNKWVKKDSRA